MAGMVARVDAAAAEAVLMLCRLDRHRLVVGNRLCSDLRLFLDSGFLLNSRFFGRFGRFCFFRLRLLVAFLVVLLRVCRFLGVFQFVLLFPLILRAVLQGSVFRAAGGTVRVPHFRRTSRGADAFRPVLALGKDGRRQRRQQHPADQQDAEPSFLHILSSFSSRIVIGFPFRTRYRMHSMVTTTPNTKAAMPTRMYAPAPSRSSTAL